MKKILLIGGNGALGTYLTEEAVNAGFKTDVVCFEEMKSEKENLTYIRHDGKDLAFMRELMKNDYDAIVDFMIYPTVEEFKPLCDLYLQNTKHYLFLSTYRVYAGACPVKEDSLRLLDAEKPSDFVEKYEYSIYKAEEENYIRSKTQKHWTILRPSITYSKSRFQLTILEANSFVWRMRHGKTVVLPEEAMDVEATLSWAGDFGKSVIRLVLNEKAYGEAYTVSTAEHHTWREFAEIYAKIGGLKYVTVDMRTFIDKIYGGNVYCYQQLLYDRCYPRVIDNSKLLQATGRTQEEYMTAEDGLRRELSSYDGSLYDEKLNENMDKLLESLK